LAWTIRSGEVIAIPSAAHVRENARALSLMLTQQELAAPNGSAEGPIVGQGSSLSDSALPPSQGRCADALRPAWAS